LLIGALSAALGSVAPRTARAEGLAAYRAASRSPAPAADPRAATRALAGDTVLVESGPVAGATEAAATVIRDPSALAPEFRARLDRVLERMREEFGHSVEVLETLRSQERQDALYAQGRTRSGPVVTWTRNSAHLGGYAADVRLDGSFEENAGYARLAVVAREEGLRTLGPRDPGHVELPGAAGGPPAPAFAGAAASAPPGSARALSRIVASRGVAPSEPTVFATSPYAAVMSPRGSFLDASRSTDREVAEPDAPDDRR
jgi:hypothetical protein